MNYWKGLRVLINATLGQKKGETIVKESFMQQVNGILSKPYAELLQLERAIDDSLVSRGGSHDAFWSFVKLKIEEMKREQELQEFYNKFKETHQE